MFDNTTTISQTAGSGMPMFTRERVASVRVLSMTTGVVSLPAAGAVALAGDLGIQGTTVCGYRHLTDVTAVVKGAFPGISAWSPPI